MVKSRQIFCKSQSILNILGVETYCIGQIINNCEYLYIRLPQLTEWIEVASVCWLEPIDSINLLSHLYRLILLENGTNETKRDSQSATPSPFPRPPAGQKFRVHRNRKFGIRCLSWERRLIRFTCQFHVSSSLGSLPTHDQWSCLCHVVAAMRFKGPNVSN